MIDQPLKEVILWFELEVKYWYFDTRSGQTGASVWFPS